MCAEHEEEQGQHDPDSGTFNALPKKHIGNEIMLWYTRELVLICISVSIYMLVTVLSLTSSYLQQSAGQMVFH